MTGQGKIFCARANFSENKPDLQCDSIIRVQDWRDGYVPSLLNFDSISSFFQWRPNDPLHFPVPQTCHRRHWHRRRHLHHHDPTNDYSASLPGPPKSVSYLHSAGWRFRYKCFLPKLIGMLRALHVFATGATYLVGDKLLVDLFSEVMERRIRCYHRQTRLWKILRRIAQ